MRKNYYWVNKDTRNFMEKGYLDPGQTVEERVREIAEHAEKILQKTLKTGGVASAIEFADNFEYCMKRGWFSLSTPVWVNFGKKKGLPILLRNTS